MTYENFDQQSQDYKRIAQAIEYVGDHFQEQPGLDEIAASVHLSKYHFQRLFKNWAGVTPSQFLHYLTVEYAKRRLRESQSIFETSLDAGLSSASRLHDLFITFEAMTPGEYKHLGSGLEIRYGFHPTHFGDCLLAITQRGICALRFLNDGQWEQGLETLQSEWEQASFFETPMDTQPVIDEIFAQNSTTETRRFHLLLKGTNFQVQVWRALLEIPPGAMVSYQGVAHAVSRPSAARAVAGAIRRNPVAYLIPCHRVIARTGEIHRYRWGSVRKKAMLGWEAVQYQVSG